MIQLRIDGCVQLSFIQFYNSSTPSIIIRKAITDEFQNYLIHEFTSSFLLIPKIRVKEAIIRDSHLIQLIRVNEDKFPYCTD